jgi:Co/Zn/Cd efflux system component
VAVIIAAVVVQQLQSAWPDLLVAFLMALLFLHSAYLIIRQARSEMRTDSLATNSLAVAGVTANPE